MSFRPASEFERYGLSRPRLRALGRTLTCMLRDAEGRLPPHRWINDVIWSLAEIAPGPTKKLVYFMRTTPGAGVPDLVKIGWTQNLKSRLRSINNGSPFQVATHAALGGARPVETLVLRACAPWTTRGEWFRCTPEVIRLVDLVLELQALDLLDLQLAYNESVLDERSRPLWRRDDYLDLRITNLSRPNRKKSDHNPTGLDSGPSYRPDTGVLGSKLPAVT